jgi:hypothetical protein
MNGDDDIEQIQAHYERFQKEPTDPKHSLAIANLYEKRKEYANAIPWFQDAFDKGGCVDCALERHILDLRILGTKEEIAGLQHYLESESDPEDQAKVKASIDGLLEELRRLLLLREKQNPGAA